MYLSNFHFLDEYFKLHIDDIIIKPCNIVYLSDHIVVRILLHSSLWSGPERRVYNRLWWSLCDVAIICQATV